MKLEKFLTAIIAGICAMTFVAVSAFASSGDNSSSDSSVSDDNSGGTNGDPAYVYTWQAPASESEESGWVSKNITQTDLIGSIKPGDIKTIVIKGASADDEVGAGFNTTLSGTKAEGYYQTNDDDENWPSNSVTINGSAVDWDNYYFQIFSNRGEATTVTVSVFTNADDNSDSSSDSDSSDAGSDSDSSVSSDSSSSTDSSDSGGLITDSNTSNSGSGANPGTGVAMTFVPAVIAGAVVIAAKKRK